MTKRNKQTTKKNQKQVTYFWQKNNLLAWLLERNVTGLQKKKMNFIFIKISTDSLRLRATLRGHSHETVNILKGEDFRA